MSDYEDISAKVNGLIGAAWDLDEVVLPAEVLQAIESGRSLFLGELLEAADALGVKPSDLVRAAGG